MKIKTAIVLLFIGLLLCLFMLIIINNPYDNVFTRLNKEYQEWKYIVSQW